MRLSAKPNVLMICGSLNQTTIRYADFPKP
jgi:hypothetical protein